MGLFQPAAAEEPIGVNPRRILNVAGFDDFSDQSKLGTDHFTTNIASIHSGQPNYTFEGG